MFGIGFFELLIIAVVALIFVGPKRLPELAKQFGRFFVQMRRVTTDVKDAFDGVIRDAEREVLEEKRNAVRQILEAVAVESRDKEKENDKETAHSLKPDEVQPYNPESSPKDI